MQDMRVETIKLSDIVPNDNVRMNIKSDDLHSLMKSIKTIGLLQPVGAKRLPGGKYKLLYGNRRFHSFKKLGHGEIPAVIHNSAESFPMEELVKHLSENNERLNFTALELGLAYKQLIDREKLTIKEVAVLCNQTSQLVSQCIGVANHDMDEDIKSKVVVSAPGIRRKQGTISASLATKLIKATKVNTLTKSQAKRVFEQAMISPKSIEANLKSYVYAARMNKPFTEMSDDDVIYSTALNVTMTAKEKVRLTNKYVKSGVYSTTSKIMRAILSGELQEKIRLLPTNK